MTGVQTCALPIYVDPQFYHEGDDKFHTIEAALGGLCGDLCDNEKKFYPPVRFVSARAKLLQIIDEILAEKSVSQVKKESRPLIQEARTWMVAAA